MRNVAIGLVVIALSRSAVHAADPKPQTGPDAKAISALIQKGLDAFDAGDLDKAQRAFSDAFDADPGNTAAARDLGIVLLQQDKTAKAGHALEVAVKVKSLDRSLVLALAAHRVLTKVPMQGVKLIIVYFDSHSAPDEPMVNALGITLSQAEIAGVQSALFLDAKQTYKKLNAKLEAAQPGKKRWGPDWMPAAAVDELQSTISALQKTLASDTAAVQSLKGKIADARKKKDAVPETGGDNNQTQKKQSLQKDIDTLNTELEKAQKEVQDTQKSLADSKPRWPSAISLESITLCDPPAIAAEPSAEKAVAAQAVDSKSADPKPVNMIPPPKPAHTVPVDVKPVEEAPKWPRSAAAFAVSPELLVTASAVTSGAAELNVQVEPTIVQTATVVRSDPASGLALLRVKGAHFNALPIGSDCKNGAVKCESFPIANVFGPVLGEVSGTVDIANEPCKARFDKTPRLAGGPLLQDGKVVGVELFDPAAKNYTDMAIVKLDDLKTLLAADAAFKSTPVNFKYSVFQITATP